MTKQEAFILLNVTADSGMQEIEDSYKSFYSDYQIRLTNAPTPNLKRLYQKNLSDLEQALNLLKNESFANEGELPSSTPVYSGYKDSIENRNSSTTEISKNNKAKTADANKNQQSKSSIFAFFVVVITLAIASYLGILYSQQIKMLENTTSDLEIANNSLANAKAELKELSNGKFVIRNSGETPITLIDYIVIYRTQEGSLKKIWGYPGVIINKNQRLQLNEFSGINVEWDGSVMFYSINVSSKNGIATFADLWSSNTSLTSGVLNIDMDKMKR